MQLVVTKVSDTELSIKTAQPVQVTDLNVVIAGAFKVKIGVETLFMPVGNSVTIDV